MLANVADDVQRRARLTPKGERTRARIVDAAAGHLPAGISSDDLSVTLLAALQGGLLLAQVQRDTRPLETAFDTILALAGITDGARSTDELSRAAEMGNYPQHARAAACGQDRAPRPFAFRLRVSTLHGWLHRGPTSPRPAPRH